MDGLTKMLWEIPSKMDDGNRMVISGEMFPKYPMVDLSGF